MKKKFKVLPGASIGWGFDFTGQVLESYFDDGSLLCPHGTSSYILKQPEQDINEKSCAGGGSVSIDPKYLEQVE